MKFGKINSPAGGIVTGKEIEMEDLIKEFLDIETAEIISESRLNDDSEVYEWCDDDGKTVTIHIFETGMAAYSDNDIVLV